MYMNFILLVLLGDIGHHPPPQNEKKATGYAHFANIF